MLTMTLPDTSPKTCYAKPPKICPRSFTETIVQIREERIFATWTDAEERNLRPACAYPGTRVLDALRTRVPGTPYTRVVG